MVKPPKPGNVVKDYYQGNAHIKICDDCCRDQTQEEKDAIVDRVTRIIMMYCKERQDAKPEDDNLLQSTPPRGERR